MSKGATTQSKIELVRDLIFGEEMERLGNDIVAIRTELAELRKEAQSWVSELRDIVEQFNAANDVSLKDLTEHLDAARSDYRKLTGLLEEKINSVDSRLSGEGTKRLDLAAMFTEMAARLNGETGRTEVTEQLESVENE